MTSIVIFSEDDAFIKQIRQATNMPVIDYEITTRTNYSQGYEYIFIIDATTVEVSVDLLNQEKFSPLFQILIADYDDHDTIEQFADKVSDIWHKPTHPAILRKRLDYARIVPDTGQHILEYIGYFTMESKNPLASVKGYAEVMISGMTGELTEQQITFLKTIVNNAKHLGSILEDLRDDAKIRNNQFLMNFAGVDLYSMFEKESLFPKSKSIQNPPLVEINLQSNLPKILADELRLAIVIDDIVRNAARSSKVLIEVSQDTSIIHFQITNYGDRVYGTYYDNPDKFYLAFSHAQNIIEHIIKEHGGEMWLEHNEDSSTFHFTIPIAQENTPND